MRAPGATQAAGTPSIQTTRSSSVELRRVRPAGSWPSRTGAAGRSTGPVRNAASSLRASIGSAGDCGGGDAVKSIDAGGVARSCATRSERRAIDTTSNVSDPCVVQRSSACRGTSSVSHAAVAGDALIRSSNMRQTSEPPSSASCRVVSSSVAFAARVLTSTRRVLRLSLRGPSPPSTTSACATGATSSLRSPSSARREPGSATRYVSSPGQSSKCPYRSRRARSSVPGGNTKPPPVSTNRARVGENSIAIRASPRRRAASMAETLTSGALGAGGPSPVRSSACIA